MTSFTKTRSSTQTGSVLALCILSVATMACSDDDTSAASDGGGGLTNMGGAGGDGAAGGGDVDDTALVFGTISSQEAGIPLDDIEVCEHDNPGNCTTTADGGAFELRVPKRSDVALVTSGGDYNPALFTVLTGALDELGPFGFLIALRSTTSGLLAQIGQAQDPSKGTVAIFADSDGVTPSLMPSSGEEPFYLVGSAISTSTMGSPMEGFMGIVNVDPGEAMFILSHANKTCTSQGWLADSGAPNEQAIVIVADHITSLTSASCQ